MTLYQGDALWDACPDGGNIEFRPGGTVVRSGGLRGASYISMFGGNHLDDGTPDSREQWWGNHLESNPDHHIHGRTGTLIAGLAMSSANLVLIAEAAREDHEWMISAGVATSVEVEASIVAARHIRLTVTVKADNVSETFFFQENWIAGPGEPV